MGTRKSNSSNMVNEIYLEERCVLNKVIKLIGKRWAVEILLLIEQGENRFSGLSACLEGISDNVLSRNLNELSNAGILKKTIFQQVPIKVEYELTPAGKTLVLLMHNLCDWGKVNVEYQEH